MADDISSMRDFNERLIDFADNMESMHKNTSAASLSFKHLVTSIFLGENALKAWDAIVTRSTWAKGLDSAFKTLRMDSDALLKSRLKLEEVEKRLTLAFDRANPGSEREHRLRDRLNIVQDELRVLARQETLDKTTRSTHPVVLGFYAAVLGSTLKLYNAHKQIGHTLIEANVQLQERIRLTEAVIHTQLELGSEFRTNQEAAKMLVDYGFDLNDSFERNLRLVVQMHDGLGMTLRTASELAAVYDRQLNISADGVADSIARVVNDTGLAADEAGRLAVNLGRAVAMLRPGMNKDLAGVTELVGRYEGALQELGGQFGGFQDLLNKMTTPEGLMSAGILGVSNPEFLASKDATKQVVDNFATYVKQTLGNTSGWDRSLRLNVIAEQFGITAQQVNLMVMAVERSNTQRNSQLTLQQRFDEQIINSAQSWQRLKASVIALTQEAVIPILHVVGPIASGLASMLNWLIKLPGAVTVVSVAFAAAVPFMIARLYSVVQAFLAVAASAHMAAMGLQARTAAEMASGLSSGGPAAMAARATTRWLPTLAMTLLRWLPVIGAGALAIMKFREYTQPISWTPAVVRESFEDALNRTLRLDARRGDMGAINSDIERMRTYYKNQGVRPGAAEQKIADVIGKLPEFIGRARFVKETGVMTVGPSQEDSQQIERLIDIQKETAVVAKQHHEAALKLLDVDKAMIRQEADRNAEQIRSQRLNGSWWWPNNGARDVLRNAWEAIPW